MRRISVAFMVVAAFMLLTAGVAQAAPAPKLKTFGTGELVGSDSATIVNGPGDSGGVFLTSKSTSSKMLNTVVFAFKSTGDVAGGAPRFSIPIDDPSTAVKLDGYAFLDAAGCGAPVGPEPVLDPTSNDVSVSTQNPACAVNFNAVADYANWTAFAAANPTWKIAAAYTPFIISDQPGDYAVEGIVLR